MVPTDEDDPALAAARAAARQLAGDWQLDADVEPVADEAEASGPRERAGEAPHPPEPAPPAGADHRPAHAGRSPEPADPPPSPEQLVEAMLFLGGPPLTADAFRAAVRVPDEVFRRAVDALAKAYRAQHRPYTIRSAGGGYVLEVLPAYRGLRAKLYAGPREARLSQPALDVLSVVAYRQPVTKADVDALRGGDSGPVLRQLARLGLVAVARRDADPAYGTTPRFLEVFRLAGLDDLPRLADTFGETPIQG